MAKKEKFKVPDDGFKISIKDSIKTKLIGIMVMVAAIPLIISIVISYNTSTNTAKNDALELLDANANFVTSEFSSIIQKNVISMETFATSPSTITYLNNYGTASAAIPDSAILTQMSLINENIGDGNDSCILALPSGEQVLRTDDQELVNISDRDYFIKCTTNKELAVSDIIVSKTTGNRITIIIVPVLDDQTGELIGTIQRSYDLNNMHEFLSENIDDGYITDTTGIVAAHATHEITTDDEPEDHSDSPFMTSTETSGMYESTASGSLAYVSWMREPVTGYTIAVCEKASLVMADARKSAMTIVVVGIVLIIIAVAISVYMSQSFAAPIKAVGQSLTSLADGKFVKVTKYTDRKDEFGAISNSTNSVIDTLDHIVSEIKSSSVNLKSSSGELSDMADQISKTAEDVSNAVMEIASGATQQADEIQQASDNVGLIGDAVGNVQTSTKDLSSLADKMKEASEVSSTSLASLQESSTEMTSKIDEISNTIQRTQNAVTSISEKVEGITSIATQTNLLSLNASIEAARAGEAGKGFAVVAEEIGKLADDSKQMADDIRKEMDVLLEQSSAAVKAAEDVKQGNTDQQIALGETLEAVNGMLADINGTVSGVQLISDGANTCESSKNSVVDTMSALSAISEENAASSEETGASMQELSATVTTLAGSANDLKDIAEKLNEEMQFFKTESN